MTTQKSLFEGLAKKDRRALAREILRMQREEERKRKRRRRIITRTSLSVVGVAAATVATIGIVNAVTGPTLGPLNMLSDGILFSGDGTATTATTTEALASDSEPVATTFDTSTGVLTIVEYVDYRSDDAALFETTNGSTVQSSVTAGYATLEIHPVALLDTDSSDYSARAANAVACVADTEPDSVLAVHNALATAQPDLTASGLSNEELVTMVEDAGVSDEDVASCITSGHFVDWVSAATTRAQENIPNADVPAVTASPTVVVNGVTYTGAYDDADEFSTFLSDTYTATVPTDDADTGDTDTESDDTESDVTE